MGRDETELSVQVRIERSLLRDDGSHTDVDIERDSIGDRRKTRDTMEFQVIQAEV
jgi:hypothetical protein